MPWRLNTALTAFRAAVDRAYPNRDRASDGTIGDEAHQQTTSDHNPDADGTVDAWDMDVNLRTSDDVAAVEHLKRVFQAHPSARYWIHDRQIAHRSTGWRRDRYTGSNPHTMHVHWNSNQATENSTAPWTIEEDDMANFEDRHAAAIEYMDGRIEAEAHGRDVVRQGLKGAGQPVWMVTAVKSILAGQSAQKLRDEAILAAVKGDADRDAILARIDQRAAELAAEVNEVPRETVDALAAQSPDEAAAALIAAVGPDRAAEIAAAVAARTQA